MRFLDREICTSPFWIKTILPRTKCVKCICVCTPPSPLPPHPLSSSSEHLDMEEFSELTLYRQILALGFRRDLKTRQTFKVFIISSALDHTPWGPISFCAPVFSTESQ